MATMKITRIDETREFNVLYNNEVIGQMKPEGKGWVVKEATSSFWSDYVFEDRKEAALELKRAGEIFENYDADLERLKRMCGFKKESGTALSMREMKTLLDDKENTKLKVKDFLKE